MDLDTILGSAAEIYNSVQCPDIRRGVALLAGDLIRSFDADGDELSVLFDLAVKQVVGE